MALTGRRLTGWTFFVLRLTLKPMHAAPTVRIEGAAPTALHAANLFWLAWTSWDILGVEKFRGDANLFTSAQQTGAHSKREARKSRKEATPRRPARSIVNKLGHSPEGEQPEWTGGADYAKPGLQTRRGENRPLCKVKPTVRIGAPWEKGKTEILEQATACSSSRKALVTNHRTAASLLRRGRGSFFWRNTPKQPRP
jgi:hypothetical protein